MNKQKLYILSFIVWSASLIQSCSIKKFIPEGELLYTGAKLEIKSDSVISRESLLKDELEKTFRPTPNKKILGTYVGLYYYYKNQKDKPGFINKWLYKKIGQKPVYKSSVNPIDVEELLVNRLENRGFFYSEATSQFEDKEDNKTSSIEYSVKVPTSYNMVKYQLDSMPQPLHEEIKQSVSKTRFEPGMRFDLSNLKIERERIDIDLKRRGYYNFSSSFLIFEADTNQYDRKRFDLFLTLKNEVPKKSIVPYRISKINVYPDYHAESEQFDSKRFNNKNYIQEEEVFKPKYLDKYITLEEGQLYNPQTSKNTARRLSTIGAYKFVNIQYKEIDSLLCDSLGVLEANIFLSPLNKRAVRAEVQAVSKSNNFAGPHLVLSYSNRNIFKGGETFNVSGNFGYEFQAGGGGSSSGKNSIDIGVKTELIFPRVLFPIKINDDFFKYDIPKTKMGIGVNYLSRSQLYTLLGATAQFGYVWQANRYMSHEIIPVSINYTKLSQTTQEFEDILEENPFLKRSFDQKFISGLNYSFTYNGMVDTDRTHQFHINTTLDVAGNSISIFGKENDMGNKSFLGLEYAQYAKADIDLRYHLNFGKEQLIATRVFGGYGMPYGNSEVMPFIKQYYAGGPYSIRAFRTRSLGPGTYNDANDEGNYFDKTANIRLEANVEYRFPIYSFLKGAVFADAGNIWNSKPNEIFGGEDKFSSSFIKELGMGVGVGLRVDVQGFVIRFDFATPFHDPSQEQGSRYDFDLKKTVFNFAIGYPF